MRHRYRDVRLRFVRAAIAASCSFCIADVGAAHASTVRYDPVDERIEFVADPGRANRVTVRATDAAVTIVDHGAILKPGARCRRRASDKAVCDLAAVRYVSIGTGAGDDVVVARNSGRVELRLRGGFGADRLTGSAARDLLDGGPGDDLLVGGGGDDLIYARTGDDVVHGGDGLDVIFGGPGDDRLYGEEHEDYILGEAGQDRIDAGDDNDLVMAGTGNDYVHGGTSPDDGGWDYVLHGGPGNDRIYGGVGQDRLIGDRGRDVLDGGPGRDRFDARDGERDTLLCDHSERNVAADVGDDALGCLLSPVVGAPDPKNAIGEWLEEPLELLEGFGGGTVAGIGGIAADVFPNRFAWRAEHANPLIVRPTTGYDDQVMHLTLLDASLRLAKPIDRWYLWFWTHDAPVMRLYTAPAATGPYTERTTTAAHPPIGYHPAHWSSGDVAWDPVSGYFYSTPHSIRAGKNLNNEPTIDLTATQTSFVMRSADGREWTLLSNDPMVVPGTDNDAFDSYEIAYGRFLRDIDGNLVTVSDAAGHREYVWYYRGTRRVGDGSQFALGVATSRDLVTWHKRSAQPIGVLPDGEIFGLGSPILRDDGTVAFTITYQGMVYESVSGDPFSPVTLPGKAVFQHSAGLYDSSSIVRDGDELRMVFGSVAAVSGSIAKPGVMMASKSYSPVSGRGG